MRRSRRAVGDDILGLAALRRFVEMHHLLDQPEILLGELEHDLIDMGVADIDVAAVDRGVAVEHDAVAESVAQAELMRRRVNRHHLAQRVDQRLGSRPAGTPPASAILATMKRTGSSVLP